jgi:hypothetical protein
MNKNNILLTALLLILSAYPAFSEENAGENQNTPEENKDFMYGKKLNIELGISGLMVQAKAIFLLNDNVNPYLRFGFGGAATRPVQYLSLVGADVEAGVKYNVYSTKNNRKRTLNNIYIKAFGGATKTTGSQSSLFPFAGTGIGFNSTFVSLEFSIGLDIGSTFEYFPGSGLGGVVFIRPEINLGYVF